MYNVYDKLKKYRIVPVIAIDDPDKALPLADALIEGGLPLIEITFRTSAAAEVIARLRRERTDLLVGAGTVLTRDDLKSAIDNGALFGVAPGFNPKIIEEALKNNFPFMPGIMTPSDIEAGLALCIQTFKFFPAEAAGGIKYLTSIAAPYLHKKIKFVPTGGVNITNLRDYLSIDSVMAVGGTWIAKSDDLKSGNWEKIRSNCRAALNKIQTPV